MLNDLLLSVCIPTYNRPELIARTLRSVSVASEKVEIIVTDNSQNNATEIAVNSVMKSAPCSWRYHRNNFSADNSNFELMVMNLNMGVSMAKGRFIYIIHDDDFVVDDGIDMLLADLEGRAAKYPVIKYGAHLVDIDGNIIRTERSRTDRVLQPRDALKAVLSDSSFARFPSVLFRRDVYDKVGDWSIEAAGPLDFEMYVRAFREFGIVEYSDILGCYTIHDQAQTMNLFNRDKVEVLLKIFEQADPAGLLDDEELKSARALFFHQFILGGTYRLLKWLRFRDAKMVMGLFSVPAVNELSTPVKWLPIKLVFRFALLFTRP